MTSAAREARADEAPGRPVGVMGDGPVALGEDFATFGVDRGRWDSKERPGEALACANRTGTLGRQDSIDEGLRVDTLPLCRSMGVQTSQPAATQIRMWDVMGRLGCATNQTDSSS